MVLMLYMIRRTTRSPTLYVPIKNDKRLTGQRRTSASLHSYNGKHEGRRRRIPVTRFRNERRNRHGGFCVGWRGICAGVPDFSRQLAALTVTTAV